MADIWIDQDKCCGCGLCVKVCPYDLFAIEAVKTGQAAQAGEPGTTSAKMVARHVGGDCFLCGHCKAVCPAGAVRIPELRDVGIVEQDVASASFESLGKLMGERRSCRNYLEQSVQEDLLAELVELATTAPSGTNSQGWHFVVLPTRDDVVAFAELIGRFYRRLNTLASLPLLADILSLCGQAGLKRYRARYLSSVADALNQWQDHGRDRLFHGAAAAVLVCCDKQASCPAEDALLAAGQILLGAQAAGLGSCLIGFAVEAMRRDRRIADRLGIPSDQTVYAVIGLGYPAFGYQRFSGRKPVDVRFVSL